MNITSRITACALAVGLSGVVSHANADATLSFTNAPISAVCPAPRMMAYLESPDAPPKFSREWKDIAGEAHCRTVKNDRPLIVIKIGSTIFHGREYRMAEIMPAGVVVSLDGFGGPYYLLASHIKKLPTAEQLQANVKAFLPTIVQYSTEPVEPSGAAPSPPPPVAAPDPEPEAAPKAGLNSAPNL